jgi:acetoin utilization deacetylase AcuC-like enzyme
MLVYHHPDQEGHDPEQVFRGGKFIPQPDRAERYRIFLDIVRQGGHEVREAELGSLDEILEVHDGDYVNFLQSIYARWAEHPEFGPDVVPNVHPTHRMYRKPTELLGELGWYTNSTSCPITKDTWESVFASAHVAINAARDVADGKKAVYALCRPPGHHAYPDLMTGVCFLNNAAIAANQLVKRFGKVAIVDIDVHHGNGTQHVFYQRPDVLVCSIHVDPTLSAPFYAGHADEIGEGDGRGFNFNQPLPWATEDYVWLAALNRAINRISGFTPGALVVSLGLDASEHDPFSTFRITNSGFGRAGAALSEMGLPTLLVQEGGYINSELGSCLNSFLSAFKA